MASPGRDELLEAARAALTVNGQLIASPANLAIARPGGGTVLGIVRGIKVRPRQAVIEERAPEFGAEVVDVVDVGRAWVLTCALRDYENTAIQRVFPGSTLGAARRMITDDGTARAGARRSDASIPIVFWPDDAVNHYGVLFHRALPLPAESAEIDLELGDETLIGVAFWAIRAAANSRSVSIGLIADLAGRL